MRRMSARKPACHGSSQGRKHLIFARVFSSQSSDSTSEACMILSARKSSFCHSEPMPWLACGKTYDCHAVSSPQTILDSQSLLTIRTDAIFADREERMQTCTRTDVFSVNFDNSIEEVQAFSRMLMVYLWTCSSTDMFEH